MIFGSFECKGTSSRQIIQQSNYFLFTIYLVDTWFFTSSFLSPSDWHEFLWCVVISFILQITLSKLLYLIYKLVDHKVTCYKILSKTLLTSAWNFLKILGWIMFRMNSYGNTHYINPSGLAGINLSGLICLSKCD